MKIINGHKMHLMRGGGIHQYLNSWNEGYPDREPNFMHLLSTEIEPGMTIFEIGGNIGYQTFRMYEGLDGKGKIIVFEPDPRNFELLNKNVIENGYENLIELYPNAVADSVGVSELHLSSATNLSSLIESRHTTQGKVKVNCVSITDFANSKNIVPNFIKMDIEGMEVLALKGMRELIEKDFPCKILFEVHPNVYSQELNLEDELKYFISKGFNVKYVISATNEVPEQYSERGYYPIKRLGDGRAIYDNISNEDAILFTCSGMQSYHVAKAKYGKIVRFLMLERNA